MISVGLPAYKSKYLKTAIESVLNQTYTQFELIIVNDKSPEDILSVVKMFDDDRIRYYENEENLGGKNLVSSWNKCLEYANGEYFVLFSDDDTYEKVFLETMVKLANKHESASVFHCRIKQIDKNGEVLKYSPICSELETSLEMIWNITFEHRLQFAPEFMVKTKAIKDIGGFYDLPLAWGSDYVTWLRLGHIGGIAYSDKILCSWRISESNISSIGNIGLRLKGILGFESWISDYLDNFAPGNQYESNVIDQIKKRYKQTFLKKREYLLQQEMKGKNIFYLTWKISFYLNLGYTFRSIIKSMLKTR